jgi:hypothetical protein
MKKEERTPEIMATVVFDDVKEFELKESDFAVKKQMGFKF